MPTLKPNGKRLNGKGSGWIQPTRRLAIYLRDGFQCQYCGTDLKDLNPRFITLDHLRPRKSGGSHKSTNLITACANCNFCRQHKPWRTFIRDRWSMGNRAAHANVADSIIERIEKQTRRVLNITLAKAILSGEVSRGEVLR